MLHFRAPSNLLQRWNESLIAPFEQLLNSCDMGWVRIEVIALIGVLFRQTDDIEQMLSNLVGVRRWLPLFTLALTMNVYRPNRDRVSARSMVRVIRAIGMEGIRDLQIADLATARNFVVEVVTASLSPKGAIEPACAAAVRTTVGHWISRTASRRRFGDASIHWSCLRRRAATGIRVPADKGDRA